MFLVVIVTLLISIIGLFAQVVSVQTARIYSKENGFMQAMLIWHGAAVALVHSASTPPDSYPLSPGCRLTNPVAAATASTVPLCTTGGGASTMAVSAANLPVGWNMGAGGYHFYSVLFQSTSPAANYVITFVANASGYADSKGYLYLPDSSASFTSGYTAADLMVQLQRSAPNGTAYGVVTANPDGSPTEILTEINRAGGWSSPTNTVYEVPTWIPVGAVGILSPAN